MFDVLKTLSGLVQKRQVVTPSKRTAVKPPTATAQKQTVVTQKPYVQQAPQMGQQADQARESVHNAEARAKEIVLEARDEALRVLRDAEDEARKKIAAAAKQGGIVEEQAKQVAEKLSTAEAKIAEIESLKNKHSEQLERAAHLTSEEAKNLILKEVREGLREEIAKEIKESQIQAREQAEEKAREILVEAMRHGATDYVAEYTVSVVKITDEEMKGRIIGKEGRNIRAFETATGVDVDLDEEGVIRLSSFDPVRREIARVALERLLRDGRIQPGRIEEIVDHVKKEVDRIMFEEGQKLCHEVGVYNLPAPIVALLGRFKYRFSYGQNMIAHTLEETKVGVALANEIGSDVNIVRLGCLLHDVGKVVTDREGSHVDLGVELLKKYGMPQKVIDCVAQHHEDTPFTSTEAVLVYIADAISGSRPGARYEDYAEYVKRLKELEDIARAKEGVKETYAFQAGRELRVIVDPGTVDDARATILAQEIKKEIEEKLTYPGQIKISVIRELRATEIAK